MLRDHGFISPSDLGFIYLVDTPEEVLPIIRTFYPEGYSLNF
jgi:predicted Rossmann-fold nucleotide-binding protein